MRRSDDIRTVIDFGMDVAHGKYLERVGKCCYLEKVLNGSGGSTAASFAKIPMCIWKI